MQVRDIVMNPYLKREEEFLGILYKLRMVAADQLATIMGVSTHYIYKLKKDMNKSGEMVITHYNRGRRARRLPFPAEYKRGPRMYSLGSGGRTVVEAIFGYPIYLKKHTGKQKVHYYGVNDVLVRTLNRLVDEETQNVSEKEESLIRVKAWERLEWLNTQDAIKVLDHAWAPILEKEKKKDQKEVQRDLIYPDARIIVDGKAIWLEYDNLSEQLREPEGDKNFQLKVTTIEDKMGRYIFSLVPIENKDPIVWITPSPIRRDNMRALWEEICASLPNEKLPEMFFCIPGEEQHIFRQS